MMSIALLIVIGFAWAAIPRYYGYFSLIGAGLLGFTAYSVPAVLGLMLPVSLGSGRGFVPTSNEATAVMIVAWVALICVLLLRPPRRSTTQTAERVTPLDVRRCRMFVWLAAALSTALFSWIAVNDDPLFFLRPREDNIQYAELKTLWRWVNGLGILVAVLARMRLVAALFIAFSFIYFVAGDRTMIAIVGVAVAVYLLRGKPLIRTALKPMNAALGVLLVALIFFGKPVYLSIKAGAWAPLLSSFEAGRSLQSANNFEPFITHYLLEVVIQNDFQTPLSEFAIGVLGQALIVPSMFGIDSSSFNVNLTERFFASITYGLAYNFWAQAYSLGGYAMVIVFAAIYGGTLRLTDRYSTRLGPLGAAAMTLAGALVAVYAHRNSLENLLAFVRQIVIVFAPLYILTVVAVPRRIETLHGPLRP
jgi:hypothetical protein